MVPFSVLVGCIARLLSGSGAEPIDDLVPHFGGFPIPRALLVELFVEAQNMIRLKKLQECKGRGFNHAQAAQMIAKRFLSFGGIARIYPRRISFYRKYISSFVISFSSSSRTSHTFLSTLTH
jgi:hypothetical protein